MVLRGGGAGGVRDAHDGATRDEHAVVGLVQVESSRPIALKAPGFKPLCLSSDILVSKFAFSNATCAATLWAYAKLGRMPGDTTWAALDRAAGRLARDMSAQELGREGCVSL